MCRFRPPFCYSKLISLFSLTTRHDKKSKKLSLSSYFETKQIIFYENCLHETYIYIKNNELQMSTAENKNVTAINKNKVPPHLTAVVCLYRWIETLRVASGVAIKARSSNSRCDWPGKNITDPVEQLTCRKMRLQKRFSEGWITN